MTSGDKPQFVNKVVQVKKYTQKQSRYDHTPRAPFAQLLLAPRNSGKTNLILNQCLDIYRDCFEKIVVFSHSWNTDSTWLPLKKYMQEKEWNLQECGFSEYSDEALAKVIAEQSAIVRYQKSHGQTQIYGILIIFDDMIDSRAAMRGKQIEILYARGRHIFCSVISSTQAYKRGASNLVRFNSDHELVWRLRNGQDLDAWMTENSAILGYDQLYAQKNGLNGAKEWLKTHAFN